MGKKAVAPALLHLHAALRFYGPRVCRACPREQCGRIRVHTSRNAHVRHYPGREKYAQRDRCAVPERLQ
jgi:hypothetical protein